MRPTAARGAVAPVDLLGRVVSYADAWTDDATRSTYDQAGRLVTSDGPRGRIDVDYDDGRVKYQHVGDPGALTPGPVLAAPFYDLTTGELSAVAYCASSQTTGACATGT